MKICQECQNPFDDSKDKRKKFCNLSCAAKFNNRHYPKDFPGPKNPKRKVKSKEPVGKCENCFNEISYNKEQGRNRWIYIKYCENCDTKVKRRAAKILNLTKGSIFTSRSWQAARSLIQSNARKIFKIANPTMKCLICNYTNHVEVAHIKSVSSFPGDTKISEINNINNLIGLCPNHHWEYDHGVIDLNNWLQNRELNAG